MISSLETNWKKRGIWGSAHFSDEMTGFVRPFSLTPHLFMTSCPHSLIGSGTLQRNYYPQRCLYVADVASASLVSDDCVHEFSSAEIGYCAVFI